MTGLQGDEAALYERYHYRLLRTVRRRVNAPPELIEDACASAWMILLRSQPERSHTLFGWLITVAVHEVYALHGRERRERPLSEYTSHDAERHGEVMFTRHASLEDKLEARRALAVIDALPQKAQRYLALQLAGHSYNSICEITGASWTNVNKWLTKARRALEATGEGGEDPPAGA